MNLIRFDDWWSRRWAWLQLYASVLLKDPSQTAKGRSLLEKALSLDANCLTAVFMLVDALEQVPPLRQTARTH